MEYFKLYTVEVIERSMFCVKILMFFRPEASQLSLRTVFELREDGRATDGCSINFYTAK